MRVAIGGLDLDHAIAHFQHRHVEGAAAQVKDQNGFIGLLLQAIGQRGSRRLIDDALDIQAGNFACVFGRLALCVVEIGRHRDHRIGDRLAQVSLGVGLEFLQDHGRDFLRRVRLAIDRQPHLHIAGRPASHRVGHHLLLDLRLSQAAPHEALDRKNRIFRVHHRLALGRLPHQALAGLGKRHHRRRRARAFGVCNHRHIATFYYGNTRIRRSQVNAYNLSHRLPPNKSIQKAIFKKMPGRSRRGTRPDCVPLF